MAGVTPQGFITKTQQQIVDKITSRLEQRFGKDFPTSPDSVAGQYTNIIAASLKENWDLGQEVADAQVRDRAEGVYLDYLADLIGLTRRRASGSTGLVKFTGFEGTEIPLSTVLEDNLRRKVLTTLPLTLTATGCYDCTLGISNVVDGFTYSINIGSNKYSYTAQTPAVKQDILNNLSGQIDEDPTVSSQVVDEKIKITNDILSNDLTITSSANILIDQISGVIESEAVESGPNSFPQNTINSIISDIRDAEVTNPTNFTLGRFRETDAELRQRMAEQEENTGTATTPAIKASLGEIEGVTGAIVRTNRSAEVDANGLPPKSFKCFVTGGDEDKIAEVIYATQPAGIESVGDIVKIIIDENGDDQEVYFSRKSSDFAWIRIQYSINPEEPVPSDPEADIALSVVEYGNNLSQGEDYDRGKFYGPIYRNVQGVFVDNIEIAVTTNELDTPSYQTARIPVSETQNLIFDTSRVEFV